MSTPRMREMGDSQGLASSPNTLKLELEVKVPTNTEQANCEYCYISPYPSSLHSLRRSYFHHESKTPTLFATEKDLHKMQIKNFTNTKGSLVVLIERKMLNEWT